ncbi:Mysoin-binding motif of peroxisome [Phytophthora infestans]|uniref:Mysoin-binding motif of peroxisome n=1 Tax=Phytophthora infestans TaxID=4787 RepID=A0A833SA46_PHYIN|nr:Mysoin-binding motif of peroxisome [Phytophthora infestans]KAF4127870.1 Peroxisome mysoin-binding motif-containing protein [Phytophthora infestans]
MEIAVASTSPLGQYLAELEADGGESMGQLLSEPRSAVSRKRPRRPTGGQARVSSWKRMAQSLRRQFEVMAVHQLLPRLCVFHPTIREELQAASDSAVFVKLCEARRGWWTERIALVEVLSGVEISEVIVWEVCGGVGGASVAVIALAAHLSSGEVFVLHLVGWVAASSLAVLLLLELSMQLFFAWLAHRSKRLVTSLNRFLAALEKLNEVYAASLTLVKRAELASRGYRLGGGLLPPVGRLEASTTERGRSVEDVTVTAAKTQLRCLPLRRKLRALNDQLHLQVFAFVDEGEKNDDTKTRDPGDEDDAIDEQAPSLLLTALEKQRNRAVLLLENAVHAALVRSMARACPARDKMANCSLFRTLDSHQTAVDQLIQFLSVWKADLDAWNTSKDPVALLTTHPKINSRERQLTPSIPVDPRLKSVATQLQDLRAISETFTALAIAAQYELLSADSAAGSLSSSRDAMRSMVHQLEEMWGKYNSALSALKGGENSQDTMVDEETEVEDCESKLTESVTPLSDVTPTDHNCTIVFTGTSTGNDNFDLLALLKHQEADTAAASSGPTPHFVRELQDVLAHRVPGLTKHVDLDPPIPPAPPVTSLAAGTLRSPFPVNAMFALPHAPPRGGPRRPPALAAREPRGTICPTSSRGNELSVAVATAFNLELQALLQRAPTSQHQSSIDYFGERADESEVDSLTAEKSEVFH